MEQSHPIYLFLTYMRDFHLIIYHNEVGNIPTPMTFHRTQHISLKSRDKTQTKNTQIPTLIYFGIHLETLAVRIKI